MVKFDHIRLDKNNVEFNNAAELIRLNNKFVYLTGKAGTGKTTFLKFIKDTTDKNTIVVAPTGVAAINAGGVTIHSFFQIPLGPFIPDDPRLRTRPTEDGNNQTIFTTFQYTQRKREIIQKLELLIIDEISMVRADTLDVIDRVLRVYRGNTALPFGGVQVLLIGDTFQLPPIADDDQWAILSQFYETPFFFSSKVIELSSPLYIELKKVYRQNEQDFVDLLNRVRINQVTNEDLQTLNSKYDPSFTGDGEDYINLATHKQIANETNIAKLHQINTDLYIFEANITGDFPENLKPTDHFLHLKVGCQIMFVKNDTGEARRYYNGKIGKIHELSETSIKVIFDDETEVEVEPAIWNNIQYTYNNHTRKVEEEIKGTFRQFPIRLAWAITVHKSQGLTFEKVIADLNQAFAPGQVYVALSRCTKLSGLKLRTPITRHAIITDPHVLEFARNETPGTLITEQLTAGKADFYYKAAREHFAKGNILSSFENFKKALKFRNDIETETFEKFIRIYSSRLLSFRNSLRLLSEKHAEQNRKLEVAEGTILSQLKEISDQNQKISDQQSSIEILLNKTRVFEQKNAQAIKENMQLRNEAQINQSKLSQLESDLERTKSELIQRKKESESQKSEIKRLRNLKWYDKLFGKE